VKRESIYVEGGSHLLSVLVCDEAVPLVKGYSVSPSCMLWRENVQQQA
jgi:hypothetical protein